MHINNQWLSVGWNELKPYFLCLIQDKLFVFGGNFGYSANDTPLWILDTGKDDESGR